MPSCSINAYDSNGGGRAPLTGQITAQNHSATHIIYKSQGGWGSSGEQYPVGCTVTGVPPQWPQAVELETEDQTPRSSVSHYYCV